MRFRLLLGRLAIKGLLINPTHSFLLPHPRIGAGEVINGSPSASSGKARSSKHQSGGSR
jgi:hypothetical protein